ncbi:MAG TPA: cyclic 2,3-diphosphoglycerate synthase [Acidimicrobiia bacterium]|nr:cyclic 2,3-diphosphoglycerate synthase [Acidimicrobiia bacterium]
MRRIVIMGAGGRDFHNFNTVFRDDVSTRVVAFTAAQIPGIDDRRYPPSLAGPLYPEGIPIRPESELEALIRAEHVDDVVFAYSDMPHVDVMHLASRALAAGADFRLLGPRDTMLRSRKPVIAVCATRTGCGKSQTSRRIGQLLLDAGLKVALVRHPMPYGDLERMRVQRFETLADIDASNPTIEEREEYEAPVRMGMVMWAGVDYADILHGAEAEADVVIWDGGNNDFSFFRPDVYITVADPLRPGHELLSHPGETNLRLADVVVVNKVDSADPADVTKVVDNVRVANPGATIVHAASPVTIDDGPSLTGKRVVVVEDGPTITHGGMPFGAGTVAAQRAGAVVVDPRPFAVGSMRATLAKFPHIGPVLPAMGYSDEQLADLAASLRAVDCDAVLAGTPMDLAHLLDAGKPIRRVTYELAEVGHPTLAEVLAPHLETWAAARHHVG